MIDRELARLRLDSQLLSRRPFDRPADAVAWLGAVQAQDYQGSLWALGLRVAGCRQGDVERAIAEGLIVRTWPMRGMFDEYTVAYRDRSGVVDSTFGKLGADLLIGSTVAIGGIVRGSWRRRLRRNRVVVTTGLASAPSESEAVAIAAAAADYGRFLGLQAVVETGEAAIGRSVGRGKSISEVDHDS